MKKLIFLLLLAQTISFLYADSACRGYRRYQGAYGMDSDPTDKNAWRWGVKAPLKVRCDCPCMQYKQLANHKCIMCGHVRVPENLILTDTPESKIVIPTMTIKKANKSHATKAERKEASKAKRKAQAEKNSDDKAAKKLHHQSKVELQNQCYQCQQDTA